MNNTNNNDTDHNDTDHNDTPQFGTKHWIANALIRKFEGTPERPAEQLTSIADYLYLEELERLLWPESIPKTEINWIDPPDYLQ